MANIFLVNKKLKYHTDEQSGYGSWTHCKREAFRCLSFYDDTSRALHCDTFCVRPQMVTRNCALSHKFSALKQIEKILPNIFLRGFERWFKHSSRDSHHFTWWGNIKISLLCKTFVLCEYNSNGKFNSLVSIATSCPKCLIA